MSVNCYIKYIKIIQNICTMYILLHVRGKISTGSRGASVYPCPRCHNYEDDKGKSL